MRKCLLLVIFTIAGISFGQDQWTQITPLEYCPSFKIEFSPKSTGEYLIRIPSGDNSSPLSRTVKDINDLSSLTDVLVTQSAKFCSNGRSFLGIDGDELVFEEEGKFENLVCRQPIDYTTPYVEFTQDIVQALHGDKNGCESLMAYTELQSKIKELRGRDLIEIERTGSILQRALQVITDNQTDKLVDMFKSCGGRKSSEKFIANLILLEAQNACIMPKPPGLLSFDKTKQLALEVASRYKNMSLVGLGTKTEKITKDAMLAFVDVILKNEIEKLIPNQIDDLDRFISNLESVKEFKRAKLGKLDKDYLGLGFTFDATMEIAQKAVPILAQGAFINKLPGHWNDQQKERFFKNRMLPIIDDGYNQCMQAHFERAGNGSSLELKLSKRKLLKQQYCDKFPEDCKGQSCEKKTNMLSQKQDVSDIQVVQGCAMNALLLSIKPLIKVGIEEQRETFKKDFELNDQAVQELSDATFSDLVQCANRKLVNGQSARKDFTDPHKSPLLSEEQHLQKADAKEFEEIIVDCANIAEIGVAKDFFAKTLLSQKALANQYQSDEKVEFAGGTYDKALKDKVDDILNEGYNACIYAQQFNQNNDPETKTVIRNPLLCVPAVEILAAKEVVIDTLKGLFEKADMQDSPGAVLAIKKLDNCSEEAIKSSLEAIGTSSGKISNSDDAQEYLAKNNEFYDCVKASVMDVVDVYGGDIFDKEVSKLAGQLKDPGYVKSLKDGALQSAKACFENEVASVKNWREFMVFNDNDGIKSAEQKCAAVALDYILPKALIRETAKQLSPLRDEGLISNDSQTGNILASAAFNLRKTYNLAPPSELKGDELIEWSFAQAHNAHIAKDGNDTNTFVKEYTEHAMDKAISVIHSNVKAKTNELAGNQYNEFFEKVTPGCLLKGYTKFNPEFTKLLDDIGNAPAFQDKVKEEPLINEIGTTLVSALSYIKGLGANTYKEKLNELDSVCKKFDNYSTPRDLAETKAFDFLIKGILENTLADAFMNIAKDQCLDDLTERLQNTLMPEIKDACRQTDSVEIAKAFSLLITSYPTSTKPALQKELTFIQERHMDMAQLVKDKLHDPKYLERTLFNDRSNKVMSYIYDNFTAVVTEDKDKMQALTKIIAEKLFRDTLRGGFADEFAKAQLINGLGLAGYKQADASITVEKMDQSLSWIQDVFVAKNKAVKVAKEGLFNLWTPKGIKEMVSWNSIELNQREFLLSSLYVNVIGPTLGGEQGNMDAITDDLNEHVETYNYPIDQKSFEQRVTEKITKYVEDNQSRILGFGN